MNSNNNSDSNSNLKIKIPIYVNSVLVEDTHTTLKVAGRLLDTSSCSKQDVITISMPISEISTEINCLYMQGDVQIQRTNQCGKTETSETISIYSFKLSQIITALKGIQNISLYPNVNDVFLGEFIKFNCILFKERYFSYFENILFDINAGFSVIPKYILENKEIDSAKLTTAIYNDVTELIKDGCVMYYGQNSPCTGFKMLIDEKLILDSCIGIEGLPVTVIGKGIKKYQSNQSIFKDEYDKLKYYLRKKCHTKSKPEYIEILPLAILI